MVKGLAASALAAPLA
ncbi:hypothetical protein BRM42_06640, partial [Xanthomonas oryzae pv. oryzae]